MLQQLLKDLLQFLSTSTGLWTLLGLGCLSALCIIYHHKRQIPGLTIENIEDDTWFINRDDNHRVAIVVSLRLSNKSGTPIRVRKCKLSGYSPQDPPPEMFLEGYDKTILLEYPTHDLYSNPEYIRREYLAPDDAIGGYYCK